MSTYDLYGTTSGNINAIKMQLENVLNIAFAAHDSSYQGEYFQCGKASDEHFVLKQNIDPIDSTPAETAFPTYKIILYINDTFRDLHLREKIEGIDGLTLLRHEELD